MKIKSILPVALCIFIGFFMSNFMFNQYDKKVSISTSYNKVYFLQIGIYESKEVMEESLKEIETYIYEEQNHLYYAYVGICKNEKNLQKIEDYFNKRKFVIYRKEKNINKEEFLSILNQYDTILENTKDLDAIYNIEKQVLEKYEELVIHG